MSKQSQASDNKENKFCSIFIINVFDFLFFTNPTTTYIQNSVKSEKKLSNL